MMLKIVCWDTFKWLIACCVVDILLCKMGGYNIADTSTEIHIQSKVFSFDSNTEK